MRILKILKVIEHIYLYDDKRVELVLYELDCILEDNIRESIFIGKDIINLLSDKLNISDILNLNETVIHKNE